MKRTVRIIIDSPSYKIAIWRDFKTSAQSRFTVTCTRLYIFSNLYDVRILFICLGRMSVCMYVMQECTHSSARTPRRLNFARWRLILVNPHCVTEFMSPVWGPRIFGTSWIFGNFMHLCVNVVLFICILSDHLNVTFVTRINIFFYFKHIFLFLTQKSRN